MGLLFIGTRGHSAYNRGGSNSHSKVIPMTPLAPCPYAWTVTKAAINPVRHLASGAFSFTKTTKKGQRRKDNEMAKKRKFLSFHLSKAANAATRGNKLANIQFLPDGELTITLPKGVGHRVEVHTMDEPLLRQCIARLAQEQRPSQQSGVDHVARELPPTRSAGPR